jgi:L-alanine-DL-glutamate epimerase-like enolase superfamily enzyme
LARDGLDVERVRAVRSVTDLPLQVDVNEYWKPEEALENVHALAELGVQDVEQPLPAGHPEG